MFYEVPLTLAAATVPGMRSRPIPLLRQRDFRLLWLGWTVSQVGSEVTVVALPLVAVLTLEASTFEVGVLTAAGSAAWLLIGLPAGVWVDRLRRQRVLVTADMGRALLVGSVPVAAVTGWLTVGQLYAVALMAGVLTVLFDVAEPAYLPALVPREDFVRANGLLRASASAAMVGGPGVGGLLVRIFGASLALVADAISYLLSAALLARIRAREIPPGQPERNLRRELVQGLRRAYGTPLLRALVVAAALANLLFAANQALIIVFLVREVGLSAGLIGVLLAAGGLGGVAGGAVAGIFAARVGAGRALVLSVLVMAPARLLIPLTAGGPALMLFVVGAFAFGVGVVVFNVTMASFVQAATPAMLLGRVTASLRFVSRGILPFGGVVGGALGAWLGPRDALWALAAGWWLVPLWMLSSPLRRLRDLPEEGDQTCEEPHFGGASSCDRVMPDDA